MRELYIIYWLNSPLTKNQVNMFCVILIGSLRNKGQFSYSEYV